MPNTLDEYFKKLTAEEIATIKKIVADPKLRLQYLKIGADFLRQHDHSQKMYDRVRKSLTVGFKKS